MWHYSAFRKALSAPAAAAIIFGTSTSLVLAQDSCDLDDLLISLGQIEYVDHGSEGPSVGDKRILLLHLDDESGARVGHVNAISTVLHGTDDASTTIHVEGTVHLEDGRFHWTNTQTLADPSDTSRSTSDEVSSVVFGGTGVFQNATGIMLSRPEGDGGRLIFDLSC